MIWLTLVRRLSAASDMSTTIFPRARLMKASMSREGNALVEPSAPTPMDSRTVEGRFVSARFLERVQIARLTKHRGVLGPACTQERHSEMFKEAVGLNALTHSSDRTTSIFALDSHRGISLRGKKMLKTRNVLFVRLLQDSRELVRALFWRVREHAIVCVHKQTLSVSI